MYGVVWAGVISQRSISTVPYFLGDVIPSIMLCICQLGMIRMRAYYCTRGLMQLKQHWRLNWSVYSLRVCGVLSLFSLLSYTVPKSHDLLFYCSFTRYLTRYHTTPCHTLTHAGLKSKDMKVVQQGLRTYMLIDRVVDAESIFINTVVKPFVAKVCIVLYCVVLYCIVLYCVVLYFIALIFFTQEIYTPWQFFNLNKFP